jgi:molybdate transport system substrate-binding protein
MIRRLLIHAAALALVLSFQVTPRDGLCTEPQKLYLYAGAGMKKPMDVVIEKFKQVHGVEVVPNYGPSGGLYAQITKGQPCDIYYCADWMYIEKLEKDQLLIEKRKFLTDSIVVIVSKTGSAKITSFNDLTKEGVVLAVGDTRAPVGEYTENGLKKLGLWYKIVAQGNIKAMPSTVNQIAIMVQEDQVDAGFVFKSVATMYGLKPVQTMGPDLTGEIVFGMGIIKGGNEALARKFRAFARKQVGEFTKYGWQAYE